MRASIRVNLSIYRMYVVDRAAGIKARSIFSRPNGIIWSNDVNGIRELAAGRRLAQLRLRELQSAPGRDEGYSGCHAGGWASQSRLPAQCRPLGNWRAVG
jgi:hypothetical protein